MSSSMSVLKRIGDYNDYFIDTYSLEFDIGHLGIKVSPARCISRNRKIMEIGLKVDSIVGTSSSSSSSTNISNDHILNLANQLPKGTILPNDIIAEVNGIPLGHFVTSTCIKVLINECKKKIHFLRIIPKKKKKTTTSSKDDEKKISSSGIIEDDDEEENLSLQEPNEHDIDLLHDVLPILYGSGTNTDTNTTIGNTGSIIDNEQQLVNLPDGKLHISLKALNDNDLYSGGRRGWIKVSNVNVSGSKKKKSTGTGTGTGSSGIVKMDCKLAKGDIICKVNGIDLSYFHFSTSVNLFKVAKNRYVSVIKYFDILNGSSSNGSNDNDSVEIDNKYNDNNDNDNDNDVDDNNTFELSSPGSSIISPIRRHNYQAEEDDNIAVDDNDDDDNDDVASSIALSSPMSTLRGESFLSDGSPSPTRRQHRQQDISKLSEPSINITHRTSHSQIPYQYNKYKKVTMEPGTKTSINSKSGQRPSTRGSSGRNHHTYTTTSSMKVLQSPRRRRDRDNMNNTSLLSGKIKGWHLVSKHFLDRYFKSRFRP